MSNTTVQPPLPTTGDTQHALMGHPLTDAQRATLQAIADDPRQHDARRIWARQLLAIPRRAA